jgi:hypothetical protein
MGAAVGETVSQPPEDDELLGGARPTAVSRLLATLVAPCAVLLLGRVPCPGVELALEESSRLARPSLGALGIMPFVGAVMLVELAALLVPRWRWMREEPRGRRRLMTASVALAVALASFQAFGVVRFVQAGRPASGPFFTSSPWLLWLSLVAGFCLTLLVAAFVGARGTVNGVVAVWLSHWVIGWMGRPHVLPGILGLGTGASLEVGRDVLLLATVAAFTVVSARSSRRWGALVAVAAPAGRAYRVSPGTTHPWVGIPAPAAGVVAASLTTTAFGAAASWLSVTPPPAPVMLLVAALLAVLLAWLFHRPAALGEAWACPAAEVAPALRGAMIHAVGFTLVVLGACQILGRDPFDAVMAAWLAAASLDAWARLRGGRFVRPLRVVHRPYEAQAALVRLAAAGLRARLWDVRSRTLGQFFAPFVPIVLAVHDDDRQAARDVLARPERLMPERVRDLVVGLATAAALLIAAGVANRGLEAAFPPHLVAVGPPVTLEIVAVDDDTEWLAEHVARAPAGVRFEVEAAPLGPGRSEPRRYAWRVGDTVAADLERWAASLVPAGRRLAWGRVYEPDDGGSIVAVGWRTYLLHDGVIIDGSDVADALAIIDDRDEIRGGSWYVHVELDPEGAQRFFEATTRLVRRRFAIVVNGVVTSAPEVREAIGGGRLRISMGGGSAAEEHAEALRIEAALRAGRR